MDNRTILVVEDNDRLRRYIRGTLEKVGFRVREAESGKTAYAILRSEFLDLVLLDLRLGDVDGLEILKTIRRQDEQLPVIIVSSVDDRDVKVDGFEVGCDDYVTKPFYAEELLGRVRRLLRRARPRPEGDRIVPETIASGPFTLDVSSLSVHKNGVPIQMRKKLFELFLFFVRHPDMVLTKEALFDRAWDARDGMNENSLYVHIRQLRLLIEDDPATPHFIRTVRSAGFLYSVHGIAEEAAIHETSVS